MITFKPRYNYIQKGIKVNLILSALFSLLVNAGFTDDIPIRYEFSASTADENHITAMGAEFGKMPLAKIEFGKLPTDNSFPDATDGKGMIITANPGETAMIFLPVVQSKQMGIIRCSVRTDSPDASIYLASINQGPKAFISTITPGNGDYFQNKWQRLSGFYAPPSTGFQSLIQVMNTSKTNPLTVYVDNFTIYLLQYNNFYNPDFLDGDDKDPDQISVSNVSLRYPGQSLTINIPGLPENAEKLELVWIPAGSFLMGSPRSENGHRFNEEPQHEVVITKGFYMAKFETTSAQYLLYDPNHYGKSEFIVNKGNDYPVSVSYRKTFQFCYWLNSQCKTELQGMKFRLPTEAEWEYACRAGTTTRRYWGDDENEDQATKYANVADITLKKELPDYIINGFNCNDGYTGAAPVGMYRPNAFGLYDMLGNLEEYCSDYLAQYEPGIQEDPKMITGAKKAVRGGNSYSDTSRIRAAWRFAVSVDDTTYSTIGFRVVLQ